MPLMEALSRARESDAGLHLSNISRARHFEESPHDVTLWSCPPDEVDSQGKATSLAPQAGHTGKMGHALSFCQV